jgi:glycosyltransferase involved in cell wall biosynthesis
LRIDPEEPIDILIPTYNSARYLDKAIGSIERSVPINRIIAADHYSTDRTLDILRNHEAIVYFEDKSLGYARQLLISKAQTRAFMMLDSDVILYSSNWYPMALQLLGTTIDKRQRVGAVALIPNTRPPLELQKYLDFWWNLSPSLRRDFFVTHSTLFLKDAVRKIKIPPSLGAAEDVFIWLHMRRRGYTSRTLRVDGVHEFAYGSQKGYWMGAGLRTLQGYVGLEVVPFVTRNLCVYPLLFVVASLGTGDPAVIVYNLKRWIAYVKGYSNPGRFWQINRNGQD